MWPSSAIQDPCIGVRLLYPKTATNLSLIDHALYVYPPFEMSEQTKFNFLNGAIRLPNTTRAYDYSLCISSQRFSLLPHSAQRVAFAIIGGHDSLKAKEHSDSAQSWYDREVVKIEEARRTSRERIKDIQLEVYPNPARGNIYLQLHHPHKYLKAKIFDALGKLVTSIAVSNEPTALRLQNGIYFCYLKDSNKTIIKKLVMIK